MSVARVTESVLYEGLLGSFLGVYILLVYAMISQSEVKLGSGITYSHKKRPLQSHVERIRGLNRTSRSSHRAATGPIESSSVEGPGSPPYTATPALNPDLASIVSDAPQASTMHECRAQVLQQLLVFYITITAVVLITCRLRLVPTQHPPPNPSRDSLTASSMRYSTPRPLLSSYTGTSSSGTPPEDAYTALMAHISHLGPSELDTFLAMCDSDPESLASVLDDDELALVLFAQEAEGLLQIARDHMLEDNGDEDSDELLDELLRMEENAEY
ncbi:hypothetical protein C8Q74DRAFT_1337556, partial [Fomes fomentarius]